VPCIFPKKVGESLDLLNFDQTLPQPLLGIDEVGLGCIAGPIISAGVILPKDYALKRLLIKSGVRDSKKISPERRSIAFEAIVSSGASCFTSIVCAADIDNLSLNVCVDRTYREIISKALASQRVKTILLDGSRKPRIDYQVKTLIGADDISLAVAAASIVAKHHRDGFMLKLCEDKEFRGYGWSRNKGYPTREHKKALAKLGPTSRHRMSTKSLKRYRTSTTTPLGSRLVDA